MRVNAVGVLKVFLCLCAASIGNVSKEWDFPGELLETLSIQIRCSLIAEELNNMALCRKSGCSKYHKF
ncbi:hypothetical protein I3760_11G093900 [Carya illinoinensis]|uniref:Secreted protein n=1 Tax=Carya illinoinensis TaxID=32201 RepID=A0A922DNI7_CARIL|nr:hypothetical protein I3760_11G093900 [Carya illinoinensis]KAG6687856.1 hypothetical protein I3842_11G095500 [Carya illinoinensis]